MSGILWTQSKFRTKLFVYVVLLCSAIWVLVPIYWAVINSFKTLEQTFQAGAFIPFLDFSPTLETWRTLINDSGAIHALMSSTIISIGTTILVLLLGVPAAYSLARFEFKIKSTDITLWFLSQRILPPVVVLIPFYMVMVALHLIDTWIGLILAYSTFNLAFGVVIMRDIFRDVSGEIEDAAKVEGASLWQVFWMVALPLSLDGLIVTAIIVFAFTWNEALFAVALTSDHAQTLGAFILSSRGTRGVNFNVASATTLIAILPPVIASLFVQRYLARGLSFGAVKG